MPLNTSVQRNGSNDSGSHSPRSPTISLRDVQNDPATSQFQLTNIEDPNDIAQELSNLQALRRMSMDVGNMKDPDMPPMTLSNIPSMAPSGDDDEGDPSRLLWVPARVHPELAPSEFQSFLETRVNSVRRRSRDSSLSADSDPGRGGSLSIGVGSLSRQKSTLSRQVDAGNEGAASNIDGADQLAQQRSRRGQHNRELSLDDLVNDPTKTAKRLAEESQAPPEGAESSADDIILPMAPGMGLRRSTRTQYRKGGSLRSGDKGMSRRHTSRQQDSEGADPAPPMPEAPPGHGLSRVQTEPISSENFSRPPRSARRPQGGIIQESPETLAALEGSISSPEDPPQSHQDQLPIRSASTASPSTAYEQSRDDSYGNRMAPRNDTPQQDYDSEPPVAEPPPKSIRRKVSHTTNNQPPHPPPQQQYTSKSQSQGQSHNLDEQLGAGPSPFPSSGSGRTDSLTFIPTINEDKKSDKRSKKDDDASSTKSSSSAWKGWFKGGSSDDKKKDDSKKSKTKQLVEKAQDNVRLDVIQHSIDKTSAPPKGRESFVLDRDAVDSKLQEERKKENNRRSDSKKEKDGPGIFSSIFGGSKKKEEKDRNSKRSQHLRVPSEQPVIKSLEPDVDYHWTRFPLLEERAIYRMAHIKLANPRRPLISQVLLSNFMYSYLAIVQAMHPNMNVPVSPQQKRQEEEARRKQEEEEYLEQQHGDDEGMEQYDFDYHRVSNDWITHNPSANLGQGHAQYADQGSNGQVEYVDEAQIYEDEHGDSYHQQQQQQQHHRHQSHQQQQHHHQHQDYGYDAQDQYDHKEYYQYHDNGGHRRHDDRDDMW